MLVADIPVTYNDTAVDSHYEYVIPQTTEALETSSVPSFFLGNEISSSGKESSTTDNPSDDSTSDFQALNLSTYGSFVASSNQEVSNEVAYPEINTFDYSDVHFRQTAKSDSQARDLTVTSAVPTDAELLAKAREIVGIFSDGFQWGDLAEIVKQSYTFLSSYEGLSRDDVKNGTITILNDIIDITDTPYLPDSFTDPLFKLMVPAFVSLFSDAMYGMIEALPTEPATLPTAAGLLEFASTLKASFADGFQWGDIATCIGASIQFVGTFSSLTLIDKEACVVQIVDDLIDMTNIKYLPDGIIHPIFKAMAKPFIEYIFKEITSFTTPAVTPTA